MLNTPPCGEYFVVLFFGFNGDFDDAGEAGEDGEDTKFVDAFAGDLDEFARLGGGV